MCKRFLLLLALGLLSLPALAQDSPANPADPSVGYIKCPTGQDSVFLYQTVTVFEVLSSPRCDERVEILGRVNTLGGYLRVRTAGGQEGFVPQDEVTSGAPVHPRAATPPPPPRPVPAAHGPLLAGPLSNRNSNSDLGYDIPRVEVFGGYSYLSQDWESFASRSGIHGLNTSATLNLTPWLGVEGGASGHYQRNCLATTGLTCTIYTAMGGPRITAHPSTGLTAFGHTLVGLAALRTNASGSSLTWKHLAWAAGGGVDYAVSNRFSIRLGQVDYLRTQFFQSMGGTHQNDIRVSAGIVLRMGKVITE
jgi:opacity protein-like surface antigen